MASTKQLVFQALNSALYSSQNPAASSDTSKKPDSVDGFISGQALAEKCGVSRTAVWKAINSLIKDGMEIEAVTNRGYKLKKNNCALSEKQMLSFVPEDSGISFEIHQVLDSTNLECKRLCAQSANFRNPDGSLTEQGKKLHLHVILADTQTAGRGRMGRTFYSPAKNGVYMSIIYIPQKAIVQPARMTATAAVAVCHAIKKVFSLEAKIKWVNDIFVNGKKICGILTEGITNFETGRIEAAIIGIGINICEEDSGFPAEIAKIAGTLLGRTNASDKRNELAAQTAIEFAKLYNAQENDFSSPAAKRIMQEYKERTFLIGKTIEISPVIDGKEKYKAKAVDITEDASLVVQKEDGNIVTLQSGEVHLDSASFSNFLI